MDFEPILAKAVATSLLEAERRNYFSELQAMYLKKRDFLYKVLKEAGLNPIMPQGSFFIMADISKLKLDPSLGRDNITGLCMDVHDWRVARWLTKEIGVAGIPGSAFYWFVLVFGMAFLSRLICWFSEAHEMTDLVRFAFCKTDEELEKAKVNLLKLKSVL